jgi:putative ABC transport system permease protein
MWRVGLYDLLHRRRRFVLAVVAAALAFGLSLLMSGVIAHLQNETDRIVALFRADRFLTAAGGTGPFTTTRLLPADAVAAVAREPGVRRADPFIQAREMLKGKDVNVLGVVAGGLGAPQTTSGRQPKGTGEIVVDEVLGYHVGDTLRLGDRQFRVVGTAVDTTYYFGQPTVFMSVSDVQNQFLAGQPFVTAIAVRGRLDHAPPGTKLYDTAGVRTDLNRPQKQGNQTVVIFDTLLWLMAAGIVATMVYLTALERARDIAVMKAMGTPNRTLFWGMATQGLVLAVSAGLVGTLVGMLLSPSMPFRVEVPTGAYVQLGVVTIVVGLVAALVGLRHAVKIDPALAFGRQA